MSDQEPAQPGGPHAHRNPFVTLLMFLVGIILLSPGVCSLIIVGITLTEEGFATDTGGALPGLIVAFFIFSLLGAGGVALIIQAYRRGRGA
jgi:hypothetical protein